jgi:SAM-dependent methyltransferase
VSNHSNHQEVLGEVGGVVERIVPGHVPDDWTSDHVARYAWVARKAVSALVLDLGCGIGYGAPLLRRSRTRVVSLDRSHVALRFGHERYGLTPVEADAHSLPFAEGAFDEVACFETIEHVVDPSEMLREVSRVLRPGGVLLLSTPNARLSEEENPHHLREFELEELLKLVRAVGLRPLDIAGQHWLLKGWVFRKVPGFRRLGYELTRRFGVLRFPHALAEPVYWCLRVAKAS